MNIIERVAKEHNESPENVRREMEYAIDQAFPNNDPKVQRKLNEYFPDGKPSVEEFIEKISNVISSRGAC